MKLFATSNVAAARSFITFIFFLLFLSFSVQITFAAATPFRSANIVETNSLTNTSTYTNLNNCSATDGLTCDKPSDKGTVDLYFRDFGTYADFGMPQGSIITAVRIKATGKTNLTTYVGLTINNPFVWPFTTSNCQSPSDLWSLGYLNSGTIKNKLFITNVINTGTVTQAVSGHCLSSSFFDDKQMRLKINGSSAYPWTANIDNLEIAFDYDPPITPTPTPAPTPTPSPSPTPTPALNPTPTPIATPTPTPIPKTPLILIPGIGGSELQTAEEVNWIEPDGHYFYFDHVYPEGEKVWVNLGVKNLIGSQDYFDVLRMNKTGTLGMANLIVTGNLVDLIYKQTLDFFTAQGYTLDKDLFVFPYDWRRDISETKDLLDKEIRSIKTQTGNEKVDIVAHSMGGLVARNYISDLNNAQNINKLFTLGTPHLGSVDFLKNLNYGGCLTRPGMLTDLAKNGICLGISPPEVNDVIQNMISVYELAPTQKYYEFYSGEDLDHPYPFNDVNDIDGNDVKGVLDYFQTKTLLNNLGHNTQLFYPAEDFHKLDENFANTNGVEVYNIVGSGLATLGQISEKKGKDFFGMDVTKKDEMLINGDRVVPLISASLIDYKKSLSLLGDAKVYYTNQNHGDLVASGSALLLVKNILDGNNNLPDGVSITPYSFGGTMVSGHSPINLDVYDSSGNHTGLTDSGDIEQNIPGSFYDALDDAKFIYLPDEGTYSIKVAATDQGSFDLNIRKFENSQNISTNSYQNVPLTLNTKAEMTLNTSSPNDSVLQVDENGDGSYETTVLPGEVVTPTSTPTPTPTPTPTSTPTTSTSNSTGNSISSTSDQTTSTIVEALNPVSFLDQKENNDDASNIKEVAGVTTFNSSSKENIKKDKNQIPVLEILVLISGLALIFFKN